MPDSDSSPERHSGASGESPPRRFSLAGKIAAGFAAILVLIAGLAVGGTLLDLDRWTVFLIVLIVCLPLGVWMIARMLKPLDTVVSGVSDGIRSFRDRDFSVRLAYRRDDELGDLVELYNKVGEILLEERRSLMQQELLLKTALDRSPAATVLVNPIDRVIYSNKEARSLFTGGGKLEGMKLRRHPRRLSSRDARDSRQRRRWPVHGDGRGPERDLPLSQRVFTLNRRRHC